MQVGVVVELEIMEDAMNYRRSCGVAAPDLISVDDSTGGGPTSLAVSFFNRLQVVDTVYSDG